MTACIARGVVLLAATQSGFALAYTLDELINYSVNSYPAISSSRFMRESAQYDLTTAKLSFLPALLVSTQRNRIAYSNASSASQLPSTTATVSQPLFAGGGLIAGYDRAKERLSAADYALLETAEDLARQVITTYVQWYSANSRAAILKRSVSEHLKLNQLITHRYEAGVASLADKNLADLRLEQARAEMESAKSQEQISRVALTELVGRELTIEALMVNKGVVQPPPLSIRAESVGLALERNPSILKKRHEALAAEAEARQARAQALPQVSFQAQRQVGNAYTPGWPSYNSAGLVAQLQMGNGFSTVSIASSAYSRQKSAEQAAETTSREIKTKIMAELSSLEYSTLREKSLSLSAKQSNEVSASYLRQYVAGRKGWLDLMNSIKDQVQSELILVDAISEKLGSSYRLAVYINGVEMVE